MQDRAIVLFAHGARDPDWARPFRQLVAEIGARLPGERIVLAFLELMQPSLPDCVAALHADGVRALRIVPVFLGVGGHLRGDLPKMVEDLRGCYPDLQIAVDPAIGEQPRVISAIADAVARGG